MQAIASPANVIDFKRRTPPTPPVTIPNPLSAHQVAFILKRSPIMALLEQVIEATTLDSPAKLKAVATAERRFEELIIHGRARRTNPWPAIRLLEEFGFRPVRIERDNVTGVTPIGTSFTVPLPRDPPCSANNA